MDTVWNTDHLISIVSHDRVSCQEHTSVETIPSYKFQKVKDYSVWGRLYKCRDIFDRHRQLSKMLLAYTISSIGFHFNCFQKCWKNKWPIIWHSLLPRTHQCPDNSTLKFRNINDKAVWDHLRKGHCTFVHQHHLSKTLLVFTISSVGFNLTSKYG